MCSIAQVRDVVKVTREGTRKEQMRGLNKSAEKRQINHIHDEEQYRVIHFRVLESVSQILICLAKCNYKNEEKKLLELCILRI